MKELAQKYLDDLKNVKNELDSVSLELEKMRNNDVVDVDKYEELYAYEFELSITLHGIYEEIERIIQNPKFNESEFVIYKLKKDADKIFKPIVLGK